MASARDRLDSSPGHGRGVTAPDPGGFDRTHQAQQPSAACAVPTRAAGEEHTGAMAVQMRDLMKAGFGDLRTHPVGARVQARLGNEVVVSSSRALLVWEPRRVVPTYAVPTADVYAQLVPWAGASGEEHGFSIDALGGGARVLDPRSPFTAHTTPGRGLSIHTGQGDLEGAAHAPDDPDLADHVILDFAAFTAWTEEDDPVVGHPQDPFHRVACRQTGAHVVVSLDGEVLAESRQAVLLLETMLPGRYYLPKSAVRPGVLSPSSTRTLCAYKGEASYWSARVGDREVPDLAWSYEEPLTEAAPVAGGVCFWNEHTDLTIDGEPVPRPVTPWSTPS